MNIPDLGSFFGNRDVTMRQKMEKAAETTENSRTASLETEDTGSAQTVNATDTMETTDTGAVASRDVFAASENRQRIDELVQAAEETEDTVRADRVEEVRQRVASRYYDNPDFLSRLALQITTIGEG